jgi:hypothetical protein
MMSADRWLTPKALIDRTVDLGKTTMGWETIPMAIRAMRLIEVKGAGGEAMSRSSWGPSATAEATRVQWLLRL